MSAIPLPERSAIVFDLDDTLYPERDFVRSGFQAVAELAARETTAPVYQRLVELFNGGHRDPLGEVQRRFRLSLDRQTLLDTYRQHFPRIELSPRVADLLSRLQTSGHLLGLLTDGRSLTQRNKIRALGLERWFEQIVISEEFGSAKPDARNYRHFESSFRRREFVYVGDNPAKDFLTPNRLGWMTVGVLDRGSHIHSQAAECAPDALPQAWIEHLA